MPADNFHQKVVYLILADSARKATKQWVEEHVLKSRKVHAMHWMFLQVSSGAFSPPQPEVTVDDKECVQPIMEALSKMWSFWENTYKDIIVKHVLIFMPEHGAETWMCFSNKKDNSLMPLSCSTGLYHACKVGFRRIVLYFCDGTQAITELASKDPDEPNEKIGILLVTSFDGIEWSTVTWTPRGPQRL